MITHLLIWIVGDGEIINKLSESLVAISEILLLRVQLKALCDIRLSQLIEQQAAPSPKKIELVWK